MNCVKFGVVFPELKPKTLNACWRPIWPEFVKTNDVSPVKTEFRYYNCGTCN